MSARLKTLPSGLDLQAMTAYGYKVGSVPGPRYAVGQVIIWLAEAAADQAAVTEEERTLIQAALDSLPTQLPADAVDLAGRRRS